MLKFDISSWDSNVRLILFHFNPSKIEVEDLNYVSYWSTNSKDMARFVSLRVLGEHCKPCKAYTMGVWNESVIIFMNKLLHIPFRLK